MKQIHKKLILSTILFLAFLAIPVVAFANSSIFDTTNINDGFVTVFYTGGQKMCIGVRVNDGGEQYSEYLGGSRANVFFPQTGGKVTIVLYEKINEAGYNILDEIIFDAKDNNSPQNIQIKSSRTVASSVELRSANLRNLNTSTSANTANDTDSGVIQPDAAGEDVIPLASQASVNRTIPSQYNKYLTSTNEIRLSESVTAKSNELIAGKSTTEARVMAVYSFIVTNFRYDWDFYNAVKSGAVTSYTPNASKVLAARKGICYDISSLFAAMLRGVGIPTKMVKGQCSVVGGYHAWNSVYDIESDSWVSLDATVNLEGKGSSTYRLIGKGYSAESAE